MRFWDSSAIVPLLVLEKETEQPTGFHDCGSLRLAYKKEDLDWFKYVKGILDNVGAPAEIISTNEIKKLHPFIKLDGIIGAFYGLGLSETEAVKSITKSKVNICVYLFSIFGLINQAYMSPVYSNYGSA